MTYGHFSPIQLVHDKTKQVSPGLGMKWYERYDNTTITKSITVIIIITVLYKYSENVLKSTVDINRK